MSKKYENRVHALKEHMNDKDHRHHKPKKRSGRNNKGLSGYKKDQANFRKQMNKSKKIW